MKKHLLLFALGLICLASCKDDDSSKSDPVPDYEGCCGTTPTSFTIGEGKLFVPNAFTPNYDGINDLFMPFANMHVSKIENLTITSTEGGTLFSLATVEPNNPATGWNGVAAGSTSPHKGLFDYKMTVSDDSGQSVTIEGSACSILCDSAAVILKGKQECLFPTQWNGIDGGDASLPFFEDDCFGG